MIASENCAAVAGTAAVAGRQPCRRKVHVLSLCFHFTRDPSASSATVIPPYQKYISFCTSRHLLSDLIVNRIYIGTVTRALHSETDGS
jgi:hypothetical protein